MKISNYFMRILDTGSLLFVAIEGSRFVIVSKRSSKIFSCFIQKLCKVIPCQLFACPKANWWVLLWYLRNSLCTWNFRWKIINGGTFWCGKNAMALEQQFEIQISHTIPKCLIPFKCIRSSHSEVLHKAVPVLEVCYRKKNTSCSTPMFEIL